MICCQKAGGLEPATAREEGHAWGGGHYDFAYCSVEHIVTALAQSSRAVGDTGKARYVDLRSGRMPAVFVN